MGKPKYIPAPLTEQDVRRIAKEEIEKRIADDRAKQKMRDFAATYGAQKEEIRSALTGESPRAAAPEYDAIQRTHDFYAIRREMPACGPGTNAPATPGMQALLRMHDELVRLQALARKPDRIDPTLCEHRDIVPSSQYPQSRCDRCGAWVNTDTLNLSGLQQAREIASERRAAAIHSRSNRGATAAWPLTPKDASKNTRR